MMKPPFVIGLVSAIADHRAPGCVLRADEFPVDLALACRGNLRPHWSRQRHPAGPCRFEAWTGDAGAGRPGGIS